jgi:hypothetical protein
MHTIPRIRYVGRSLLAGISRGAAPIRLDHRLFRSETKRGFFFDKNPRSAGNWLKQSQQMAGIANS